MRPTNQADRDLKVAANHDPSWFRTGGNFAPLWRRRECRFWRGQWPVKIYPVLERVAFSRIFDQHIKERDRFYSVLEP
jgi:hypothetical protein